MYLLRGYIRAGSATWFPCNTCLQGNHWVITGIQHCNSTSAGTDGTILRPSYLASLPSCVRMKECQMSGFNTETLTVGCISTLIILQIYSLFLSALFLLSTWYARLLSLDTVPWLWPELVCEDCVSVRGSARAQAAVTSAGSSVRTVHSSRPPFALRPPSPSQAESAPSPTRCCDQSRSLLVCPIFVSPGALTRWAVLSTGANDQEPPLPLGASGRARGPTRAAAGVVQRGQHFPGCFLPLPQVLPTVRFPRRCYHSCLLKNSIVSFSRHPWSWILYLICTP